MFKIKISDKMIKYKNTCLLSCILQQVNSDFLMPCAGNHSCWKYRIKIISGAENISKITAEEEKYLTENDISSGIRLACFAAAYGECEISSEISYYKVHTDFNGISKNTDKNLFNGLGFAVDICTTTVVSYLYENDHLLSVVNEMNVQGKFGTDVISCIDYSNHSNESKLHLLITLHSLFGIQMKADHLFIDYKNTGLILPKCIGADIVCSILASVVQG